MTQPSIFDQPPSEVDSPVYRSPQGERSGKRLRQSADADFFAAFFRHRPNTWISALELMNERACLSFRTRLSDLRYPPYAMDIQNRQEVVQGKRYSFYRYVPSEGKP